MNRMKALAAASIFGLGGALSGCVAMAQEEAEVAAPAAPPFQGTELAAGPWSFETEQADFDVNIIARGLDHPWSLAFLPDGDMLVTERPGRLRLIHGDVLDPTPISGLPALYAVGIAGLMDIALHPDFAENGMIYISYSKPDPEDPQNAVLAVLRAHWDGGHELTQVEDIFVANAWYGAAPMPEKCCGQGPSFGSFGGRIAFDADGYLFITSGDRNYGEMVQDRSNHFGKILRLNDDGSVPADNPWVGVDGAAPEVWTTGHRNPLGLTINPADGSMWESEFGPRGGDEVNKIEAGANYGWITVTQGFHYDGTPAEAIKDVEGVTDPVLAFGPPSLNPGNLDFYSGSAFPDWQGDLFLASFTQGVLRYEMDADGNLGEPEHFLQDLAQRWRDVRTAPDGSIYALTDMTDGAVVKITAAH